MLCWKQVTRVVLLALVVAGVSTALVAGTPHPSYAQVSSSLTDPGAITDPGTGPKPGDPDGPTGDLPPSTSSTSGRSVSNGTGMPNSPTTGMVPERRGVWATLQVAFKLWLRSSFL